MILSSIDISVIIIYLFTVLVFGAWFAFSGKSAKEFMDAGRRLPGWLIGLSIFGTWFM